MVKFLVSSETLGQLDGVRQNTPGKNGRGKFLSQFLLGYFVLAFLGNCSLTLF